MTPGRKQCPDPYTLSAKGWNAAAATSMACEAPACMTMVPGGRRLCHSHSRGRSVDEPSWTSRLIGEAALRRMAP